VNLLDENIPLDQRDLLRAWGIRCRVVGQDIARLSIADDNLIVLLHRLKQPTFFTRRRLLQTRTLPSRLRTSGGQRTARPTFTRSDDLGNTPGSRR
jgi:hypothetical protein